MNLLETQELFWKLATQGLHGQEPLAHQVFIDLPPLDAVERVRIYANMFIWRQIDVLREDFPKLVAVLGDRSFYELGEAYVAQHPSTHPSLSKLGRHLSAFLERRPGVRPDLSDLAALEWARAEVFEELDAPAASPTLLQQTPPDVLAGMPLQTVPALRLFALKYDVLQVWREIDGGGPPPEPIPSALYAAAWRKGFNVYHVRIDAEEAEALRRAMSGEPLGSVCDAFSERTDAVEAALRAVGSWFVEGWIRQPAGAGERAS